MEKPIVFLSHSSKNKVELAALKALLDKRAAGSLEFFLSSDGQSIRFGRNWVARISDALKRSKLMFLFLSPESSDSKWIHFEAGCAYAQDIQVVPVCLPGMDLNRVVPPLSLLQGFNLHSYEAMGNLSRICNEVFGLKMNEAFNSEEFKSSFGDRLDTDDAFFGEYGWAVKDVSIAMYESVPPGRKFFPTQKLVDICQEKGVPCFVVAKTENEIGESATIELPGCVIEIGSKANYEKKAHETEKSHIGNDLKISCALDSKLFGKNAEVLDRWHKEAALPDLKQAVIHIESGIITERYRHRVTAMLHKSGITSAGRIELKLHDMVFQIRQRTRSPDIEFIPKGGLMKQPLKELLTTLFESGVLYEDPMGIPVR